MNIKRLVSALALFATMLSYADPIKGETSEERFARHAKESQMVKAQTPTEERETKETATSKPLTLLSKSIKKREYGVTHKIGYFEFDTDGNTNTVEVIAIQNVPCCTVEENIQAAKVGETKTASQWHAVFTHVDAEHCMGLKSLTPEIERKRHEIQWEKLYRPLERKVTFQSVANQKEMHVLQAVRHY